MTTADWDFSTAAAVYLAVVPAWQYVVAALLYYPAVKWGQRMMHERRPFQLRWWLTAWNATVSVLSGYAGLKLLLGYNLLAGDVDVCDVTVMQNPLAWYILVFNLTKPLEWIDTVFLVLRKRRVRFLHWFHHLVTALYCLHATLYSATADATGLYFASMNLLVHAVMYAYYALASVGYRDQVAPLAPCITIAQTVQMAIGLSVTLVAAFQCELAWQRNWHGLLLATYMYATYFYLFAVLLEKKLSTQSKTKTKQ